MIKRFFFCIALLAVSIQAQTPEVTSWVMNTTGATGYKGFLSNVQSVSYTTTDAYVSCTCIPGYDIGPWQSNPNIPVQENFVFKITRNPQKNTGTPVATALGHTGVWSNGVSIFNARDGMSYNNQGVWNRDALYWEGISFDNCLGHPAPNGEYHHHVNPTCLYNDKDSSRHAPIIGYAFDGYPIYGAYGYANTDGTGSIKRMRSSFVKSTATTRSNGPAVSTQYPSGCFIEDFSYVAGSGDLDEHNGRFCVTPEYPAGTYAYFVTIDDSRKPVYPYTPGPTYYGTIQPGNTGPSGGHNAIPGNAQKYTPSSTAPTISVSVLTGTSVCEGTVVKFTTSASKAGSNPTYAWFKNSVQVGSSTAEYVDSTLMNHDTIRCKMTSSDASASPATVTSTGVVMNVTARVKPTVAISAEPTAEFCEGSTISLSAKVSNGGTAPIFRWKVNGNVVGTSSTLLISSLKNGDVLVLSLSSSALCAQPATVDSDSLRFIVHPMPPIPSITHVDDELHSSATAGNQWYLDGQIIVGATSTVYRVTKNGTYRVRVTDLNGCTSSSTDFAVELNDVEDNGEYAEVRIVPQPVQDRLTVVMRDDVKQARVQLLDALGRVCVSSEGLGSQINDGRLQLDCQGLGKGLYVVVVQTNDNVFRRFVIKN